MGLWIWGKELFEFTCSKRSPRFCTRNQQFVCLLNPLCSQCYGTYLHINKQVDKSEPE